VNRTLALLLLAASPAFAFDASITAENAKRPTAFAGVAWGSSPADALRTLSARAGVNAPEQLPDDQSKLELTGGTFSGQAAEKWTLEFSNRKLFAAAVTFKSEGPAKALYRDIKQQLIVKYGAPARDGKPPIALGADRKERFAQQRNNPDQKLFGNLTQWKFTPTLADKEPKSIELILGTAGGILATDESQLVVTLRYVNDAFAPQAAGGKATGTDKPVAPRDL
jgi:hypothetical protein